MLLLQCVNEQQRVFHAATFPDEEATAEWSRDEWEGQKEGRLSQTSGPELLAAAAPSRVRLLHALRPFRICTSSFHQRLRHPFTGTTSGASNGRIFRILEKSIIPDYAISASRPSPTRGRARKVPEENQGAGNGHLLRAEQQQGLGKFAGDNTGNKL